MNNTTLSKWQDAFTIIYNLSAINELEEKTVNNTLRTQTDAINAIKLGQYLVISVADNGDFSMSASPMPHSSATAARAECKRLAQLNPGKLFTFVKFTGAELVPKNTISI